MNPDETPWVIQGETGPSTLTKWESDKVVGFEAWCATCGWHGTLSPYTTPAGETEAIMATYSEAQEHVRQTGHTWEGE